MEVRFRSIFLAVFGISALLITVPATAQSDEDEETNLIEPQIERVVFDESLIDSSDFEIAAYAGYLALENFETNVVTGIKIGYHISEDFFVQGSLGMSSSGETSFERLSGGAPLLSDSDRDVEYYLVTLGFNLLPGEAFATDSTTFNTVLYLSAGVGTTDFAGDERYTIAYAIGHRTLFADGFSVDVEMRNLLFEMDIFGENEQTNNLEFTLSLNLFI
jgi:outer membrane beta-barrel protein